MNNSLDTVHGAVGYNAHIADLIAAIDFCPTTSRAEIESALEPVASTIIDCIADAESVDLDAIYESLVVYKDDQANLVEAVIDRAFEAGLRRMPIMRTFAKNSPVKVLRGLSEISFVAGREGDDEWDWDAEASEALVDAFGFTKVSRADWFETAKAALTRAFEAGVAQREIDSAGTAVPDRSVSLARAHAVIYLDDCHFPDDRCPSAIDREVSRVAYKLAERHQLMPAEAANAAMRAFLVEGARPSVEVALHALDRARAGHVERVAMEARARRRADKAREAAASIFEPAA